MRIVFSPTNKHEFLVGGDDLRFYDISSTPPRLISISDFSGPILKAFAWSKSNNIAVGLTTGRIILTNVSNESLGEILPKHSRSCNTISFSSCDPNLLVCGFDKVRQDVSLIVYDVSTVTPIFQYGVEAVQSADWFHSNANTFVAGKGLKTIKIFDLRVDGDKNVAGLDTRAVHGITCDPFTSDQFASYDGEIISVWDKRRLSDPLVIASGVEGLTEIHWSGVKSGRLVGIGSDPSFWTWDIQSGVRTESPGVFEFLDGKGSRITTPERGLDMGVDENDVPKPLVCKTQKCMRVFLSFLVIPNRYSNIRSISWVPTEKSSYMKVLTVHEKDDSFKITRIFHHFCVSWSPFGNIAIGAGKDIEITDVVDDISVVMRDRAIAGYSLERNDVGLPVELADIWNWIASK
jgi:WD40 repeat protein